MRNTDAITTSALTGLKEAFAVAVQRHHQDASLHVIVALDAHLGQLESRLPAVVGRIDAVNSLELVLDTHTKHAQIDAPIMLSAGDENPQSAAERCTLIPARKRIVISVARRNRTASTERRAPGALRPREHDHYKPSISECIAQTTLTRTRI